jgi:hypothetical protein
VLKTWSGEGGHLVLQCCEGMLQQDPCDFKYSLDDMKAQGASRATHSPTALFLLSQWDGPGNINGVKAQVSIFGQEDG